MNIRLILKLIKPFVIRWIEGFLNGEYVGVRTTVDHDNPDGSLAVAQSDSAGGLPVIYIDQTDDSEGYIDFIGNSAASATGPISTWTTGNSVQGFVRVEINGVAYWMPYYDAPTA